VRRPSAGRGRLPLSASGTRGWLLVAALLGVVSLALPWGRWSQQLTTAPTVAPGSCTTSWSYDGYPTTDCTSMMFFPGMDLTTGGVLMGTDLHARVLLVLAALLVWRAYRRRDPGRAVVDPAAALAVALGVLAVPLVGPAAQSGQVVWALALVALVVALRRDGLLGVPDRLRTAPRT
jgi:hypothetical protein